MKDWIENYSTPFKFNGAVEFLCLNCNQKYYVLKVLGPDNVWRQLPASCRTCTPSAKIDYAELELRVMASHADKK